MPLKFSHPDADVFVPTHQAPEDALAKVTHLAIGAHQDDLEIMAYDGIVDCLETPGRAFGGVVVTDGAGSPRTGPYSNLGDKEMRQTRREEQRMAAKLGHYAIQLQLAHPSSAVKSGGVAHDVQSDLKTIFSACRPALIYLHNPMDKHDTHVGVFLRCIETLREMVPLDWKPRLLGCAVWRDLEWMIDGDKIALDTGRRPSLAAELLRVFDSQIAGGKRYDLATVGRRLAHATFDTPHAVDHLHGITWAMDLTPLIEDPKRDIADYTLRYIDRLREDVTSRLKRLR